MVELVRDGVLASAHTISLGGLGIALAECCLMREKPLGVNALFAAGPP